MSNSVYPTLSGAQMDVERVPFYDTTVQTEGSGRELRISKRSSARYRWRIRYDFLRQTASPDEANSLLYFFATHRGTWDSFFYIDPYKSTTTDVGFGTGDGTTTVFYLKDEMGDRVGGTFGTPAIYKDGVLQTVTTHYTIDANTGAVTFVTAPADTLALTWTGSFYRRVRFGSDDISTQRRTVYIWRADVDLVSVL